MNTGPSPHLSWKELACKDGTPYPAEWRTTRAVTLAAEFEIVRAAVGKPLTIGSAYRTPAHNRKVGGAKASQHMQGRALDLYPPMGMTVDELYRICRLRAVEKSSFICGLGLYPTFVHIDIRPSHQLHAWKGSRAWAELKDGD
jgi:uncharacterized protein YcbK (DUF882 family)